jgi:diacylglycerol O-acyltransferase / wax synthase
VDPDAPTPQAEEWHPQRPPSGAQLVWDALDEYTRRPSTVVDTARGAVIDVRSTAARLTGVVGGLLRTARKAILPAPQSPLNTSLGRQRRVTVARAQLDDLRKIRKAHGGTVNDVLLNVLTGALREWLLSRGQPVVAGTSVRTLVPISMQDEDVVQGNRVSSYLVDLPVGEPNPWVRLTQLSYAMRGTAQHGRSVGADSLIALTGFAPPTLHALGARAARGLSRRLFNLIVTNVPGPQVPLYAAGSQMLEVFPVVPLVSGQGLSIGMTSYNGRVFFGLNADLDSVGDVDILADLIEQEVGELVENLR